MDLILPEEMIGTSYIFHYYKNPEDRLTCAGRIKKNGKVENNEIEAFKKGWDLIFGISECSVFL